MSSFDPLRPSPILAPSLGKGLVRLGGLTGRRQGGFSAEAATVRQTQHSQKLYTPKQNTKWPKRHSQAVYTQGTSDQPSNSDLGWSERQLKRMGGGDFFDFRYLKPLLSTSVHSFIQFSSFPSALFSVGKKRYSLFLQLLVLRWWAQQFQFSDFCVCEMSQKR